MDKSVGKYLFKAMLWIFQVGLGIMILSFVLMVFSTGLYLDDSMSKFENILILGMWLLYFSMYFIVIRKLILIVRSTEETPFINDNVKRFKLMGYCLLINSIIECIIGYKSGADASFQIMSIGGKGALTPPLIICIVASLMCFVMGDVFKKAIQIKDENDLTV